MSDPSNASAEDLGEDGIANTLNGRDGTLGTVDDDVLEADGVFTVEVYSDLDRDLGLIPPGLSVGDPVPGSGEDVDGDGIYDDTLTLSDLDFADPLSTNRVGRQHRLLQRHAVLQHRRHVDLAAGRCVLHQPRVLDVQHGFRWHDDQRGAGVSQRAGDLHQRR